jgi:excisionase family DNA binding protein
MDKLLNSAEAAEKLGISRRTLRRWCAEGLIIHSRTAGGDFRFRQDAVDFFLAQHNGAKAKGKGPKSKKSRRVPIFAKTSCPPELVGLTTTKKLVP